MWDAIGQFMAQSRIARSTDASAKFPSRGPTPFRKYVVQAACPERNAMEDVLKENGFAAMIMDVGQLGPWSLFITNLMTPHIQCSFTAGIFKGETAYNHSSQCPFLAGEIPEFAGKSIITSPVTCDDVFSRMKALNDQDHDFVQSCHAAI
jgi:hypothetical protein